MRYGFGVWLKSVGALLLSLLLGCVGLGLKGSALGAIQGKHTYYLHSASSWASQKTELSVLDLRFVAGESVAVEAVEADGFIQNVLQSCAAQVQFVEEVDGVVSYYCFSQRLPQKIVLNGRAVNLHIAVSTSGAAVVGCPIIFGGF